MGVNLDKIVQDLLLIIRGSKVSQSEVISKRQIEEWIHQYRAVLLKRDIDKEYRINPDYIQEIQGLELEQVERDETISIGSDCYVTRSTEQLPKTIDLSNKPGLLFVGTYTGKQMQLVPYSTAYWQKYKKYNSADKLAFLRNGYLYITNNELLQYINIRGVFEHPLELTDFNNVDYRSNYPVPVDKVPFIKEMILKQELGIESKSPADDRNDASHGVAPQVDPELMQQRQ